MVDDNIDKPPGRLHAQCNTMDIISFECGCYEASTTPLNPNETYALCNACCILYCFSEHTFFHMEKERSTSHEVCGMHKVWIAYGYIVGRRSFMLSHHW